MVARTYNLLLYFRFLSYVRNILCSQASSTEVVGLYHLFQCEIPSFNKCILVILVFVACYILLINTFGGPVNADVNAFVQRCATCQMNARKCTNAKLASWEDAEDFFERIHINVTFYRNHTILVIVDAFCRWVDAHLLNLSARAAIQTL